MRRYAPAVAVLLAFGCSKPISAPESPGDDPSSRTTTAFNAPSTPQEMAGRCDVPIYPGAQAPDDLSRMPHKDPDGNTNYELVLTTKDSGKQVGDFYGRALKLPVSQDKNVYTLVGTSPHGSEVILHIDPEGGQTVIRIHSIAHKAV
jgi:hypothetical protein